VVQGQQSVVRLRSAELGPPITIETAPRGAQIELSGIAIGRGSWRGRLPRGRYTLQVTEPGYFHQKRDLVLTARDRSPIQLEFGLDVDPEHPRWPKQIAGHFTIGAFGGYAHALSLNGGANRNCTDLCPSQPGMNAGIGGLRAGYRFASDTALELELAYALLTQISTRQVDSTQAGIQFLLTDEIVSQGPVVALSGSQRGMLTSDVALVARVGIGVMFARASDEITGSVHDPFGGEAEIGVDGAQLVARGTPVLVQNALAVQWRSGSWLFGGALNTTLFVTAGPELTDRRVLVPLDCDNGGGGVGCAVSGTALEDESAHEILLAYGPQLSIGYEF